MKYFENKKIHWNRFSPDDVYFKSNFLTKKLNQEVNVISYNTKSEWERKYDEGIFVHVKGVKTDYPTAHINIHSKQSQKDSQGNEYNSWMNNLFYLESRHNRYEWVKDPTKKYGYVSKQINKVPLPDEEGYRIDVGGTIAGGRPQELQEQMDIVYALHDFFCDRILSVKRGTYQPKGLTLVA